MQPIRMVDLLGQHRKIEDQINQAMRSVMDTTAFIKGPHVAQFEANLARYLGVKHVIGCGNGTDALQIALMALNLPAGSEVITPDFTFVATAEVVLLLGLTPVLVDVDPDTFNLDIPALKRAISDKTRVIIPVHLFGQCADLKSIMDIAKAHDIYVIEDTAQATGASYCKEKGFSGKAGTIGHIGCTSFFPSKNLGCAGDGGAIFTNDDALAEQIKSIANHGQGDQYYYKNIGVNSRLDTLQAALLDVKLPHLDSYNQARSQAASYYDEAFKSNPHLQIPRRVFESTHIFHQYTLKVLNGKRDELMQHLNTSGIPNKVYYPVPIHKNEPYALRCRFNTEDLGNTRSLSDSVISLPMHTELTEDQLNHITQTVNQFFN